jgi:hypothetical protein
VQDGFFFGYIFFGYTGISGYTDRVFGDPFQDLVDADLVDAAFAYA